MAEIRFDNRVAIVTGAGGGLGRAHAMLLAQRGAKVVVNDPGAAVDGTGQDRSAADEVVEEIKSAGGDAVASYEGVDSAEGAQEIVRTAMEAFGRIDILVNNAGILRDVSFKKMTTDDWNGVLQVHLYGTFYMSRAAWEALRDNGFGRIINTTSAAGLYGNFGQANYAAAKMGIVGLTKTLAQEGAKYGIKCNVIAPMAKSRMTESIMPPETLEKLRPEHVSPLVAALSAERLEDTGQIYAIGGGYVARVAVLEGPGVCFEGSFTPEQMVERWPQVNALEGARPFTSAMEAVGAAMKSLGGG